MTTTTRSWPVPIGLVALSAVPVTAGTLRLIQLASGPAIIPADHRFTSSHTLPLILHIVGAAAYALVGILQFVPRFRRRHRTWHRRAGRTLAIAGLFVAISALWITLFSPAQPDTGDLLFVLRLIFASAMPACLLLGIAAARRRDITAHRAWMIRAYAVALAAGPQAFTGGVNEAIFGTDVLTGDLAKGAGWVINLAVAEWVIRRPARRRPAPSPSRQPARTPSWTPPPGPTRSASTATSTPTGRHGSTHGR